MLRFLNDSELVEQDQDEVNRILNEPSAAAVEFPFEEAAPRLTLATQDAACSPTGLPPDVPSPPNPNYLPPPPPPPPNPNPAKPTSNASSNNNSSANNNNATTPATSLDQSGGGASSAHESSHPGKPGPNFTTAKPRHSHASPPTQFAAAAGQPFLPAHHFAHVSMEQRLPHAAAIPQAHQLFPLHFGLPAHPQLTAFPFAYHPHYLNQSVRPPPFVHPNLSQPPPSLPQPHSHHHPHHHHNQQQQQQLSSLHLAALRGRAPQVVDGYQPHFAVPAMSLPPPVLSPPFLSPNPAQFFDGAAHPMDFAHHQPGPNYTTGKPPRQHSHASPPSSPPSHPSLFQQRHHHHASASAPLKTQPQHPPQPQSQPQQAPPPQQQPAQHEPEPPPSLSPPAQAQAAVADEALAASPPQPQPEPELDAAPAKSLSPAPTTPPPQSLTAVEAFPAQTLKATSPKPEHSPIFVVGEGADSSSLHAPTAFHFTFGTVNDELDEEKVDEEEEKEKEKETEPVLSEPPQQESQQLPAPETSPKASGAKAPVEDFPMCNGHATSASASPSPPPSLQNSSPKEAENGKEEVKAEAKQKTWASLLKSPSYDAIVVQTPVRVQPQPHPHPSSHKEFPAIHPNSEEELRSKDPLLQDLRQELVNVELDQSSGDLEVRGLANRGNWCYVNAVLQALLATPPFFHFLRRISERVGERRPEPSSTPTLDALLGLVRQMTGVEGGGGRLRGKRGAVEPVGIQELVTRLCPDSSASFKHGRQEDAQEFLICLLNAKHEELVALAKKDEERAEGAGRMEGDKDGEGDGEGEEEWQEVGPGRRAAVTRHHDFPHSPISRIFSGRLRYHLSDAGGGKDAVNLEPFFTLSLEIADEAVNSIDSALAAHFEKEAFRRSLPGTGATVDATKATFLDDLPQVLILHLKYFQYSGDTGSSKLFKPLPIPLQLSIPNKLIPPKTHVPDRLYKLYAVVFHHGEALAGGHYTADVWSGGRWVEVDDAKVDSVTTAHLAFDAKAFPLRVPYLLFFRRASLIPPPPTANLPASVSQGPNPPRGPKAEAKASSSAQRPRLS